MDYKLVSNDISDEEWRQYEFPGGVKVKIERPKTLFLKQPPNPPPAPGGQGHRVLDKNGVMHYVPAGWIQLTWKSDKKEPSF